jgi:predicted nucleic acid-binding protein
MGLALLEAGDRRRLLEEAFEAVIRVDLDQRILPFDETAATVAGGLAAKRQRSGRSLEFRDVQIAGIAAARRATVATRNTRHFEGLGLTLVDPWAE